MGLIRHDLAIDLGTANTVIIKDNEIAFYEPSSVAFLQNDTQPAKYLAAGSRANSMFSNYKIKSIRPLQNVDASMCPESVEFMLKQFIMAVGGKPSILGKIRKREPKMAIAVPLVVPDYLNDALHVIKNDMHYDIFVIYKPLAAATSIGKAFLEKGGMLVDLGASCTDISIIGDYGIVHNDNLTVAGDMFDNEIIKHVRDEFKISVGLTSARRAKISLGIIRNDSNEEFVLRGPNIMTGKPVEVKLTSSEIESWLDSGLSYIEERITRMIESTHPILRSYIVQNGIWLMGGTSQMKGLERRFNKKIGIQIKVVPSPRYIVAMGAYKALYDNDPCLLTL